MSNERYRGSRLFTGEPELADAPELKAPKPHGTDLQRISGISDQIITESPKRRPKGDRFASRILLPSEVSAIRVYSLHEYIWINRKLAMRTSLNESERSFIKTLTSGISKLEKYNGICSRGGRIDLRQYSSYHESKKIDHPVTKQTFFSASKDINIAYNFLDNVIYEITSVNGRMIDGLGVFNDEREIVFLPGTQFEIKDISEVELNKRIRFTRICMKEKI